MMETKLWVALCAILVIHLGSATPGPVLDHVTSSTNNSVSIPKTDQGSKGTGSSNSATSNAGITVTPKPRQNEAMAIASDATSPKTESITHPALSPSQSHPTTPVPAQTGTTHITQTHSVLNTSVTPTSSSNHNVSQPQIILEKLPQSTAPPAISTPKPGPTKPESTTITTITTTTTKSNTSSTSSSQNLTTSQLTTNTSQSSAQPTSQANSRTNDRLPLTATVSDSPALDPLLAGLVSAFIIAAVIITLLLFLKLRRRGNGPAFRRLQDLPMDDMEDTPLSMYSY